MPLNEYDSLINSSGNEYDDIIKSESESQAQQVNSAMYVAADKQPDRHAQVLDLAKKTKLPADIVERNFEEINKKNQISSVDYPDLIDKTPGLAKWLSNSDNMAVAKDDLDNLKSIESLASDSWLGKAVDSIKYGSIKMMSDIAKSPALMAYSDPTPYFLEGTSVGEEIKKEAFGPGEKKVSEGFYKNKVTKYLDEKAESYKPDSLSNSVVTQWSNGDYAGAAETWSLNVMSNLPQLGLLIATRGKSLPLLGAQSAGGKMAENLEAGVPLDTARGSALTHAGIEVGVESIGGIGASGFKESIKSLVESVGEQGAKEIIKSSAKKIAKTGFEEGAEEWVTEVAQSTVDYGLGINDKAFEGLGIRAMDSFLIGAGSGAMATSGALSLENTVKQFQKDKKIDMHKDAYLKIGEIAEQSRLKKRSGDKFKEFIESSTENTELKNVYIPVEQFNQYFQNSKIPPAKIAQDLGVLDEFNRANETGADVQIPLAQFVDKMAGTEHYQALANDIKFSPDGQTPNQANEESKKVSSDLQRVAIEGQQEPLIKTADQSAKVVQNNVKEQLKNAGFKDAEATRNAELYSAAFGTLASKSGQTAETLFNKYGLKIESMDSPTATTQTSMNQSPRLEGQSAADYLAQELSKKTPDEAVAEYYTDETSGVYNDIAFNSQPLNPDKPMAAQISVEGVKYLNETLGHGAADDLYKYVGQALQRVAPDVAKVGGDFALRVKDEAELKDIIEKVKSVMPAKIKLGDKVVNSNSFDLSAALGLDLVEAGRANVANKQLLENEGRRAKRGEMPLRYSEAEGFADSINFTPTPISKELRANYDALTPEQRLNDMYIDKQSGFLTYAAYSKLPKKAFRASIDIDGLKAVNDLYGSHNGDKMLDAFNEAIRLTLSENGMDVDMTHKSGDEYLAQFDSGDALNQFLLAVEERLKHTVIKMPLADGTVKDFVGVTFGAGIGSTDEIAERLLGERKAEKRQRAGDLGRSDRDGKNIAKGRDRRVNRTSKSGVLYSPDIAKPTEKTETKLNQDSKRIVNIDDEGVISGEIPEVGKIEGNLLSDSAIDFWFEGGERSVEDVPYSNIAVIDSVEVDPYDRKKGNGSTLVSQFIDVAANNGAEAVYLNASPFGFGRERVSLDKLEKFYSSLGFKVFEKQTANTIMYLDLSNYNDENRVARAIAQGYSADVVYHGTDGDFNSFKPSAGGHFGPGIYTFKEKSKANTENFGKKTLALRVKDRNNLDIKPLSDMRPSEITKFKKLYSSLGLPKEVMDKAIESMGSKINRTYTNQSVFIDGIRKKFDYSNEVAGNLAYVKLQDSLKDLGYTGYNAKWNNEDIEVVFDPKSLRSVTADFKDSSSENIYAQGDNDPRGRIRFGDNRQFNIDLFKSKDKSTFLHESAHFLFEVMGDLAQDVDTSQALKDDYAKLLQWLGVESREQIGVEHHERIARAFEAYLMEGKAPTSSLRKAFNTFKVWLTSIYKKVPPEKISNDVRQVFDRILATDEQIAAANSEMNYKPLVENPKSAGMNDATAAKYLEATEEARLHSEDHIRSKLMKDYLRQKEKWWKDRKAELSLEIKSELEKTNIYKAMSVLDTGKLPDGTEVGDLKLSKQSVINAYGKEFISKLPRGVTSDSGVHIDLAAELLNFESGDALVTQLANTPKLSAAVEIQANQRMNDLYPDLLTSDTLPDEAVQAVHNDSRALVHRLEWQFIADKYSSTMKDAIKRVARPLPTQKIVREQADKIVQSLKVSELRPVVYQRAEIKQHTKAGELLAKGDLLGAMEAKRLALLNHEIYRSVVSAQESVEKDVKKFKRLFKTDEDLSKSRDIDMVNAARAVLAEFGITKADKSASEYLAPMKSYDPEAYESVMSLVNTATDNAGNYKTIKYQDFVNMSEAVSAIWDLSKSSKEIEIDGKRVNSEQIKDELVATIQESVKPGAKGDEFKKTHSDWEKTKIGLLGLKSKLRRVEAFAYGIDGANKAFTRYVFQPVKEAITKYRLEKDQAMRKFQAAAMLLDKSTLTDKKIPANEIGFVFKNKTELLGAMLHTGNDSNLSKLLRGRNWGEAREDGSLDRVKWDKFVNRMQQEGVLTKSDYDFMQATWNLMEELKPAAQKAHKLINGYYFNEVTANEFITPWGSYKGGYVPAKADVFDSIAGALRADKEAIESGQNSYAFPTTGSGSTKSRVEAYATPLNLDVNLVAGHIDWVLRFSHVEPRVKEVAKIINNEGFRQELAELDPTLASEMFIPWLQRAASQRVTEASGTGPGSRQMDKFLTALRSRTGMSIMVGNLTNALQQLTGLSVAAVKVSPHRLAYALVNYAKSPFRVADEISDRSDFMKTQLKQSAMKSQDAIDDIMLNPSAWDNSKSFISKHGYFLQTSFQNVVNITTWSAAYDQAIAKGLSEADAVREADSAVRLTQGTLSPEDISSFEAGTPLKRLFTQFGGYFNMLGNLFESEYVNTMKNMGLRKGAGKLAYVYAMGFMLPSVMAELIVQGMSGKGLDADDDDEYLDDMFMIFFGSQLRTAAALFPIVGPAANTVVNTFNGKPYDDRLSTSPAIAALENAVHAPKSVYDAIHSKNKENRAVTDVLTLLSLTSGIPMAPLAKPIRYSNDVSSRKARPTGPIDYGRGLVTGKSGEPDKR